MKFKVKVYTDRGVNETIEVVADHPVTASKRAVAALKTLGVDVVKVITTKRMKEHAIETANTK